MKLSGIKKLAKEKEEKPKQSTTKLFPNKMQKILKKPEEKKPEEKVLGLKFLSKYKTKFEPKETKLLKNEPNKISTKKFEKFSKLKPKDDPPKDLLQKKFQSKLKLEKKLQFHPKPLKNDLSNHDSYFQGQKKAEGGQESFLNFYQRKKQDQQSNNDNDNRSSLQSVEFGGGGSVNQVKKKQLNFKFGTSQKNSVGTESAFHQSD